MRDLQNRCEKVGRPYPTTFMRVSNLFVYQVVELEIQLDEIREQYNNVIRNSNSKAQQKKMAFLERNLEQLTLVQKQVRSFLVKWQQWGGVSATILTQTRYYGSFHTACRSEHGIEEGSRHCRTEVIGEERADPKSRGPPPRRGSSACNPEPEVRSSITGGERTVGSSPRCAIRKQTGGGAR